MLRSILLTIFFAIVFFVAEQYFVSPWVHPLWKSILVFFGCVSILTYRLVEAGLQDNRDRLIPLYLAATVARMVLGLAFVGFFLFRQVEQRRTFILDFLVLYIFYTSFEIWTVTRNLRRDS